MEENGSMDDVSMAGVRVWKYKWWLIEYENESKEGGREWKYGGWLIEIWNYGWWKRIEVWMMVDRREWKRIEVWKVEEGGSMEDASLAGGREWKYGGWLIDVWNYGNWKRMEVWMMEVWLVEENWSMNDG